RACARACARRRGRRRRPAHDAGRRTSRLPSPSRTRCAGPSAARPPRTQPAGRTRSPAACDPPCAIFNRLHALVLAAVGIWCFLTALAGGLVGLVLGNIRLPVIVFAASSPAAGTGANIGISGVAAATAGFAHVRAGRVDWRLVRWMAPVSVVGAIGGSAVSAALPGDALLIVIGAVLLLFGLDLLRPRRRATREPGPESLPAAVAAGAVIGFLGGVVGLILGSLRMPALLGLVRADTARVIGTNLLVGVCVGVAG